MRESFGYPSLVEEFDYGKNLDLCLNYSVWDVEHGIMIKLNEQGNVIQGVKGFKRMTQKEIIDQYGDPPAYSQLKLPTPSKQLE